MPTASKIGPKFQVVIPKSIRKAAGLRVGDYVEARLTRDGIVLRPKVLVDRGLERALEEALADLAAGRVSKPFKSARDLVRAIKHAKRDARASD
jgi:AbrB family looped-hinge helix DNA binding protein